MHILVRLEATRDASYLMQYHKSLQGFIYSLIKDTKFSFLHDKKDYKFFCFTNIFPAKDLKKGESRALIISSPNPELIRTLESGLCRI